MVGLAGSVLSSVFSPVLRTTDDSQAIARGLGVGPSCATVQLQTTAHRASAVRLAIKPADLSEVRVGEAEIIYSWAKRRISEPQR